MIDNSKRLFSNEAATALGDGSVRPSVGAIAIMVGTKVEIPTNAVIEVGKFLNADKEERKYLYIKGTEPMLSLSTLLAMVPTERNFSNWNPNEDALPTLQELQALANDAYQPTSRNIEKWVNNEFADLRGKTLICTSRTEYKYGDNDFVSKYLTFKVENAAQPARRRRNNS